MLGIVLQTSKMHRLARILCSALYSRWFTPNLKALYICINILTAQKQK